MVSTIYKYDKKNIFSAKRLSKMYYFFISKYP